MVDSPQTKLLLVFLTVLVSFSAMSVTTMAYPNFNASSGNLSTSSILIVRNVTMSDTNLTYNVSASAIYGFQVNISDNQVNSTIKTGINISSVVWAFAHQNATAYSRNFTSNGTNVTKGSFTTFNVTGMGNTTNGIWWINVSQNELGAAGNWNLTIYAYNTSDVNANISGPAGNPAGTCANCSNFTVISFYVKPYTVRINLTINEINGNNTVNLAGTPTVSFKAIVNATPNSTGQPMQVKIFTNISGFVTSTAAGTSVSNTTAYNQTTIPADVTTGWNRTYNITAQIPENENITDEGNTTIYLTANDNAAPSVSISKPTTGTYYESSVTLKFSASDNVGSSCEYWVDSGSSNAASQGSDITVSSLSAADHTLNVKCTDYSSTATTTSIKFTASPAATTSVGGGVSAPIVSSSGGGATGAPEKTQVFIAKVSANKQVSIAIPTGDITQISITPKSDATSIYVNINKLSDKPADIAAPSGKVFRYLDIKPSGLDDSNIASAKIKFKVDKSWITANNIDSSKIVLARFNNNVWNNLDTTKASEDTTSITYEATTPGFSTFAITTGEQKPATPGTTPSTTPTPGTTPSRTPTTPGTTPGTTPAGELPLTAIAIVVVIVIVAVVLLRAGVI